MPKKLTQEDFLKRSWNRWGVGRFDYSNTKFEGTQTKVVITCTEHGNFDQYPTSHWNGNLGCVGCGKNGSVNTNQWIQKAHELWDGRWNYSKVNYVNRNTDVIIICSEHGEFSQSPEMHLNKQIGCSKCSGRSVTHDFWIERADELWDGRWDYSKTKFTRSNDKVIIICRDHGEFEQAAKVHMRKAVGCPECNGTGKITQARFEEKVFSVFGDRWDLSKAEYRGNSTPVTYICKEHGEFDQKPLSTFVGKVGCPRCNERGYKLDTTRIPHNKMTHEDFLEKVKSVCGDRWDLSDTEYFGWDKPVVLTCPKHGMFEQVAAGLFSGKVGCKSCRGIVFDTSSFISKARELFGDRWDYSLTKFSGNNNKVVIICPMHGPFEQLPPDHFRGRVACGMCKKKRRFTQEEFIEKSREIWGNRWDYSKSVYKGSGKSVTIVCVDHGEFEQRVSSHWNGELGCSLCRGEASDTESFIYKSKEVWGDRWDYSNTEYSGTRKNVTIICREHGPFSQSPAYHVKGRVGCGICNGQEVEFIHRAVGIWGDRWDYSETLYVNSSTPVTILCNEHGRFSQVPTSHLRGSIGCVECQGRVTSTEDFIRESMEIFGKDRWDYSNTIYTGSREHVEINCTQHGEFYQVPTSHLRGAIGCTSCAAINSSKGEKELFEFIESIGVSVTTNRRDILPNRLELDIYLPEHKIAFEYNGLYYHSENFLPNNYHYNKTQMCSDLGIRLIHVWEDQWENSKDIVQEHIKRLLGVSNRHKVSARNTQVVGVPHHEASKFLNENHIQGSVSGSIRIGLKHKEDLVAVAVFKKSGKDLVLSRYATSATVRGGHSKIISHVENTFNYRKLVTFADLSWSVGDLYCKTGWTEDKILEPDYQYIVGNKREHKFNFRKKRFKEDPNLLYESNMSERELAIVNGLKRVYDAGKIRFIKPHPDTIKNNEETS